MTIDWLHFLFSLFLLWFPRQALRLGGQIFRFGGRRHSRRDTNPAKNREPGDPAIVFSREIAKPRNYIDLIRAAAGAYVLMGGIPGVDPALVALPDATAMTRNLVLVVPMVILLIGVMIQSFRFEQRMTMFPPIWYLTGVVARLCGPMPTVLCLVLIWTINLTLPNPTGFLSVFSLLIAVFGLVFNGFEEGNVYLAFGLVILPVLVSLLARRRLVLINKRTKVATTPPMPVRTP